MNLLVRSVSFQGGKDRLERFVVREGGKMLANQRFSLTVKSTKVKQIGQLPFRFACRYQKGEDGYLIRYTPFLSVFGIVRLIALLVLVGFIAYQKQWNPYITYTVVLLWSIFSCCVQCSQCIRQFEAACKK